MYIFILHVIYVIYSLHEFQVHIHVHVYAKNNFVCDIQKILCQRFGTSTSIKCEFQTLTIDLKSQYRVNENDQETHCKY